MNIDQQTQHTMQADKRQENAVGVGLLFWLARAGQIIPPWWSKRRDEMLRVFWKDSAHFSGAMYMISSKITGVPFRVEPRDSTVKAHVKAADAFNSFLYEAPQFGMGWDDFWSRFFLDLWTSDNGAFGEVIGAGDPTGPIEGPPLGLAHLDSYNCQRTSNPEYPVIYTNSAGDGRRYRIHYTRVMYASQMPSTSSEMHGVGLCWLSRAINSVQNMVDIETYEQEKLGSRPLRAIITGSNVSTQTIIDAIGMAEEGMDNQGLSRYAKTAVLGDENREIGLELLDLISLPDGFDRRVATDLAMYTIALTGGFPPRWLWPATTTGATKADAMYQHISGSGGGLTWHLGLMQRLIAGTERGTSHSSGKVLPPYLKLVFDYQDDEQDRLQADIQSTRAKTRETDLNDGITDTRVARELAVSDGDLSQQQFDYLELKDGRLPTGDSVLMLFKNDEYSDLLNLGIDDPLATDLNDASMVQASIDEKMPVVQEIMASGSAKERVRARQALAALEELRALYGAGDAVEMIQEDLPEGDDKTDGQPPALAEDENEEDDEKSKCVCGSLHFKQDDGPLRGDFENDIETKLRPIFNQGRRDVMQALEQGDDPDLEQLRQKIKSAMIPLLSAAALFSFNQGEQQFQLFFDDGDVQERANRWSQSRSEVLSGQLINTTRNIIGQAQQQLEEGATQSEASATVSRAFNENRRQRIGVTEATLALSAGLLLYSVFARREGVEIEEIWFTREDERVCPICAPLHNKKKNEWASDFPDGPPAHPHCRCGLVLKIKKE